MGGVGAKVWKMNRISTSKTHEDKSIAKKTIRTNTEDKRALSVFIKKTVVLFTRPEVVRNQAGYESKRCWQRAWKL